MQFGLFFVWRPSLLLLCFYPMWVWVMCLWSPSDIALVIPSPSDLVSYISASSVKLFLFSINYWRSCWRLHPTVLVSLFLFRPYLSLIFLWVSMLVVALFVLPYLQVLLLDLLCIYVWSRLCLILFLNLFLLSIYCISDSGMWTFPGTTHWWRGVPTILFGQFFCGFGRRTPMVPLACNWNYVVCWGTHIMIPLVSHLPVVVYSLAYLFVGWACTTGLVVMSFPLHIKQTWSVLWMFVSLFC